MTVNGYVLSHQNPPKVTTVLTLKKNYSKVHITQFTIFTILSVQVSSIMYIRIVQ